MYLQSAALTNICPILDQVLMSFLTGKLHLTSSPPQNLLPTQWFTEITEPLARSGLNAFLNAYKWEAGTVPVLFGKWMPAGNHPSHTALSHHHNYLRTSSQLPKWALVRVRPLLPKDCTSRWINDQLLKQPCKCNCTDGAGVAACYLNFTWHKVA